MSVKIRLMRTGKIRTPYFRIVVSDSRKARNGLSIEEIGRYSPATEPSLIEVNSDRAQYWLGVGAQPTEAVEALLKITEFPVGDFVSILDISWKNHKNEILSQIKEMGFPVFVKPARAGSSVGITKVKEFSKLEEAIEEARKYDKRVIVEKSIENAREIEC